MGRGPSVWSGKGRRTLGEVQKGLEDPREGPGEVRRLTWRFWIGRGSLGEVPDGSEDPRGSPRRVWRPSIRCGIGLGTLG